jgi:hypothetical protein
VYRLKKAVRFATRRELLEARIFPLHCEGAPPLGCVVYNINLRGAKLNVVNK